MLIAKLDVLYSTLVAEWLAVACTTRAFTERLCALWLFLAMIVVTVGRVLYALHITTQLVWTELARHWCKVFLQTYVEHGLPY